MLRNTFNSKTWLIIKSWNNISKLKKGLISSLHLSIGFKTYIWVPMFWSSDTDKYESYLIGFVLSYRC